MPNWKYPCLECNKPVKSNQKGLECNTCIKWVHKKCTDLTDIQYNFLEDNENVPFYCLICKPRPLFADLIFENPTFITNLNSSLNDSTSSLDCSSANSSDFIFVDESGSDSESRGLNFESLAV